MMINTTKTSIILAIACLFFGASVHAQDAKMQAVDTGVLPSLPDDTMDPTPMRMKVDLAKRIQDNALVRPAPHGDWRTAFDVGDGDFGAAIYGRPDQMNFDIGKNDITIYDYPIDNIYPSMPFAECRKQLEKGNVAAVNKAFQATYAKSWTKDTGPQPGESWGGRLVFDFLGGKPFSDYREELDFWSATVTATFKVDGREQTVSTFASHPSEVMVIRASSAADAVAFALMRNKLAFESKSFVPRISFGEGMAFLHMTMPSGSRKDPDHYIIALGADDASLSMAAPPVPKTMAVPGNWGSCIYAAKPRHAGKPVSFFVTVVSNRDVEGPRADPAIKGRDIQEVAKSRIRNATYKGYDALRQEHLAWWRSYWDRSWVVMNEKAGEIPWYFGLYQAGSGRRAGKNPPGYYAPWRGGDALAWSRFCFNYEQVDYNNGSMVSNHGELLEPIIGTIWNTRTLASARTKAFYGMDGLSYPHCMSSRGNPQFYQNTTMNVGTSGEAVSFAWDYFVFTWDKDFLRTIGYPLLRDVAEFFRQYLQKDKDGQLYIFPSYYCEYPTFRKNSITDQVNFMMTFQHAAEAADILGVDAGKAKAWRDCMARMKPLVADKNGIWLSADTDNPTKQPVNSLGFLSMWAIFPGGLANKWNGPEALRKQAEANVKHWLGNHPETWDKGVSYLDAARMGDRDYYPKMLNGVCRNAIEWGAIIDGDDYAFLRRKGRKFANAVWNCATPKPAGILAEFLINSQFGEIRLFPAMPLTGHYAFHSLRARGGFLVSSEFRDGKVPYVLVKSLTGNPCKVIQPFDQGTDVVVRDLGTGKIVAEIPNAKLEQGVAFKTDPAHLYVVERKDAPLERVPILNLNSVASE